MQNHAFVFIKPHAVTEKVKDLVRSTLEKKGVKISEHGRIASEVNLIYCKVVNMRFLC